MIINVPFEIGEEIEINEMEKVEIKGIHIYINQEGNIEKWRFHIGNGHFVTIGRSDEQ